MVDISDKDQLRKYLIDRKVFAPGDDLYIRYFSGGVSGNVALVSDGHRQIIAKQALEKLLVEDDWYCDPARQVIEHKAQEVYARLVPESVPSPISYDDANYIMVREAAPEGCPMWKTQLLEGQLDFKVAKKTIDVLWKVHNGTAGDQEVMEDFADKEIFHDLRISPYIEWVVQKRPGLSKRAKLIIDLLMDSKIALIHGDYSPKNILVGEGKIHVLDMEVAHYGHPAFDVAFFANHFLLKAVKNKKWSKAYLNILQYMLDIYLEKITLLDAQQLEEDIVRILAFLFLARVEGKSPAEYITLAEDKALISGIALEMIHDQVKDFNATISLLVDKLP